MWKPHREALHALARREVPAHLRAKFDPEDLVQAAIMKVQRAEAPFLGRSEGEVVAYLRRALASALAELIRGFDRAKRRASSERSLDAALGAPSARGASWMVADQTSPSAGARRNEQMAALHEALAGLPASQRQAVELHYLGRFSLGETADRLGITYAAAAGLVRRGLKHLRERLVEPIT